MDRLQPGASALAFAPLFSAGGESLALGSTDGIIRVYDTGTGQLRASLGATDGKSTQLSANGHLVEKHTCAAWATAGRKKKKTTSWSGMRLIAGTAGGDVKAFDPQMGELVWRAKACIEGGVLALAYSSHRPGVVLATGASGQLVGLSMETGEVVEVFSASKHAISCLAVSADGTHAFGGGATLSLWQLSGQQCERAGKYTGHTGPATSAVFAPGGGAAASACPDERHVAVWLTSPSSSSSAAAEGPAPARKRRGLQAAATTLAMLQPPVQLDACADPDQHPPHANGNGPLLQGLPASFCLSAVSTAGDAYVWRCSSSAPQQQQQQQQPPQQTGEALQGSIVAHVRITSQAQGHSGLSDRILAAKLVLGESGLGLLVARGSTARPVFQTVPIPLHSSGAEEESAGPQGASTTATTTTSDISLPPLASGALLPGARTPGEQGGKQVQAKRSAGKGEVTVVGPGGAPGGGQDGQTLAGMRTAGVAAAAPASQQQQEVHEQQGEEDDEEEEEEDHAEGGEALQPLGERVKALAVAAGVALAARSEEAHLPQAFDKAGSLAVVLTQALRSNDRALLERCLFASSSVVINQTVSRLLPLDAAALLRAAVDRLLSMPARAVQLAPWVKATLHHHTGYLMAAAGAQAPLAALYQALDARVATYGQLLRLHGRLNLVAAHSRAQQQQQHHQQQPGAAGVGLGTVFVDAEDDDEEEEEAEDPFAVKEDDSADEEEEEEEEAQEDGWGAGAGDEDAMDEDEDDLLEDDDEEDA